MFLKAKTMPRSVVQLALSRYRENLKKGHRNAMRRVCQDVWILAMVRAEKEVSSLRMAGLHDAGTLRVAKDALMNAMRRLRE